MYVGLLMLDVFRAQDRELGPDLDLEMAGFRRMRSNTTELAEHPQ